MADKRQRIKSKKKLATKKKVGPRKLADGGFPVGTLNGGSWIKRTTDGPNERQEEKAKRKGSSGGVLPARGGIEKKLPRY